MAFLDITDDTWRSRTTAVAEVWQCREGTGLVSTEAQTQGIGGIELTVGSIREFAAGVTVYYRGKFSEQAKLWYEPR